MAKKTGGGEFYKGDGFLGQNREDMFRPELDIDQNVLEAFFKAMLSPTDETSGKDAVNMNLRDMTESYEHMDKLWESQEKLQAQRSQQDKMKADAEEKEDADFEKEMSDELIDKMMEGRPNDTIYSGEGAFNPSAFIEGWDLDEEIIDNDMFFELTLAENLPRIGEGLLDNKVALKRLEIFSKFIQEMESDFNPKAKNPKSTAAGLYHFTKDTMDTVLNRLERITGKGNLPDWAIEAKKHKDASKLSEERQTLLFYVHMFQQKGSDKLLKKIMEDGDMDAAVEYYSKLHHTDVDKGTQDRIDKIRKKYNLKDVK